MKTVVTLGAVPLMFLIVCSSSSAQSVTTGTEAVRVIDWTTVGPGSPIPEQIPTVPSDDPVEAGFAPQWVERALVDPYATSAQSKLAPAILSKHRTPGDDWAAGMEKELREIIRAKQLSPTVSRVFCNAVGCLCYLEPTQFNHPVVYRELLGKRGKKFGIKRGEIDLIQSFEQPHGPNVTWELTLVRRPNRDS